ncbi:MAG: hypothetical protein RL685_2099 [Pseudomonadota bacterium]|jgi:hypothetical protein
MGPRGLSRIHWPAAAAVGALTLAGLSWSETAKAENTIGVDVSFNNTLSDEGEKGAGLDLYFGPRMDLGLLALTTELSGGFHDFGGDLDPTVYRGMAGGRLGLFTIIRPSIFAHIGVGHVTWQEGPGDDRDGRTNIATDVGVALDFTVLPLVDLGVQLSYNTIAGGSNSAAFDWTQFGAHIVFVLDS